MFWHSWKFRIRLCKKHKHCSSRRSQMPCWMRVLGEEPSEYIPHTFSAWRGTWCPVTIGGHDTILPTGKQARPHCFGPKAFRTPRINKNIIQSLPIHKAKYFNFLPVFLAIRATVTSFFFLSFLATFNTHRSATLIHSSCTWTRLHRQICILNDIHTI